MKPLKVVLDDHQFEDNILSSVGIRDRARLKTLSHNGGDTST